MAYPLTLFVVLQLFLLLTSCPVTPSHAVIVYVDADKGNDSDDCVTSRSNLPCRTLAYAAKYSYNDTTFLVLSDLPLQAVISFTSYHNITIAGANETYKQLYCVPRNCSSTHRKNCGLFFENCANLTLLNIGVKNCGMFDRIVQQGEEINVTSGVIIKNGTGNTTFFQFTASENNGYGVLMLNTGGSVSIQRSHFIYNKQDEEIGGGGLSIVVSCKQWESTCSETGNAYIISNSTFYSNQIERENNSFSFWELLFGGGIDVNFGLNTTNNMLLIELCTFSDNTAVFGGGMFAGINSSNSSLLIVNSIFENNKAQEGCGLFIACEIGCTNNTISINNSIFSHNSVFQNVSTEKEGGGGISILISGDTTSLPDGNKFNLVNCTFISNKAWYGAGSRLYCGQQVGNAVDNLVQFINCSWIDNIGAISPAVDVSSGFNFRNQTNFVVDIKFIDCNFTKNVVNRYYYTGDKLGFYMKQYTGAFLAMQVPVCFSGNTKFVKNNGTALFATSSVITFLKGTNVKFVDNIGEFGGAITLTAFSLLQYQDNTTFHFVGNKATVGGAINVRSFDQHLSFASFVCFLSFWKPDQKPDNVTFIFNNNKAIIGIGSAIYMTSAMACERACSIILGKPGLELQNVFVNDSCFGKLLFQENESIATEGSHVYFQHSLKNVVLMPGMPYNLPIEVHDDFNNNVTDFTTFTALLGENCLTSEVSIDPAFTNVASNTIKILGLPDESCTLVLTIREPQMIQVNVEFNLTWCRPGYVLHPLYPKSGSSCVCSASLTRHYHYYGITACNSTTLAAIIEPGFWVGYDSHTELTHNNLYTAPCPTSYCNLTLNELNIPAELLKDHICQIYRQGFLCGNCITNATVFFNSYYPSCELEDNCALGPLLYIALELLPISVVFMVIILTDISLTSGVAYNIVFFAQILNTVGFSVNETVDFPPFKYLALIYGVIDLSFNFYPFCLWSGANALQIKVMKFVSLLYAVGLVIVTVLLVNRCRCGRVNRLCCHIGRQASIVQGLTAFLVICYSQCARTSFQLLTMTTVVGIGNQNKSTVVFYNGEIPYLGYDHLPYAIPAFFMLSVIVIPLPILLLCDPFLLKLEGYLIQQQVLKSTCLPWTQFRMKLKPFLDSFQGCFRDNARFFAGLFFFYRITIYITSMVVKKIVQFNMYLETLLVVMLTIQAIFQPFEKRSHNILSCCMFTVLLLMNTSTIYVYSLVISAGDQTEKLIVQCLQTMLCCVPIVVGLVACGNWFVKKIYTRRRSSVFYTEHEESLLLSRSVPGSQSPMQDRVGAF